MKGTFPIDKFRELKEITLGKSVEYLSAYCFDGTSLTDLYLKCDLPPYATELSFAGIDNVYNTCTLHVPQSSKSLLREHPSQIRVIIDHGNGIAGVVHADGITVSPKSLTCTHIFTCFRINLCPCIINYFLICFLG